MSSKRAIRRKACEGKIKHNSRNDAWAARRKLPFDESPMNIYKCKFCKKWHIGHRPEGNYGN